MITKYYNINNLHSNNVSNETITKIEKNEEKDKYVITDLYMIIKENVDINFNNNLKKNRTGEPVG